MQAANPLWIYFALTFGVIVLPGMDMAFVAGSALTSGLRGGVAAVAGIVVGGMVHVLVNVAGVTALLMVWPGAFNALLLGGSIYMAWIGGNMLASSWKVAPSSTPQASEASALGLSRAQSSSVSIFAKAVLNCLLNPKAYAFMLAVFPNFLRTPERGVTEQALLLGAIASANQIVIYGLIAVLATGAQRWADPQAGTQRWMTRGVGVTLMLVAVFTLASAWQSTGHTA